MDNNLILWPVFAQLFLCLALYVQLGLAKSKAVKLEQVDHSRRALHDDAWPDQVQQINNCIRNQFEMPILFYVLAFILWHSNTVSLYSLSLAWLFVISRIAHAAIHTGSNYVPFRKRIFMAGFFILTLLAAITALAETSH